MAAEVSGEQLVRSPIDRDEILHAMCIVSMDTSCHISRIKLFGAERNAVTTTHLSSFGALNAAKPETSTSFLFFLGTVDGLGCLSHGRTREHFSHVVGYALHVRNENKDSARSKRSISWHSSLCAYILSPK